MLALQANMNASYFVGFVAWKESPVV